MPSKSPTSVLSVASVASSPLLTYPEAARLLRISRRTLTRLVRDRAVPHLRVGAHVRFDPSALLAHFSVPPPPPSVLCCPPLKPEVPE